MTEQDNDNKQNPEAEKAEAISMGWTTRDRWRGDPDKWVDAGEYVRRGREHIPIMQGLLAREREARERERNDYNQKFDALRQDFEQRLNATGALAEQAIRRQREQHLTELEMERRRIAVSSLTPEQRAEQFEHVTRAEQDALERFRDEDSKRAEAERKRAESRQVQDAGAVPEEVREWGAENPWFYALKQAGSPIAQEAEAIHMSLVARGGMSLRDNLREVTRRMAERYPHIIQSDFAPAQKPQSHMQERHDDDADAYNELPKERRRPSSVEGQSSGRAKSQDAGVKGWRDIPAQERDVITKAFIQAGIYGNTEKDGLAKVQARAAAAYWDQYPEG